MDNLVSAGKNPDAMDAFTGGLQNQLLKDQAWKEEGLRGPQPPPLTTEIFTIDLGRGRVMG